MVLGDWGIGAICVIMYGAAAMIIADSDALRAAHQSVRDLA